MSNFSLSSVRQGQNGRRPKVEMPEKTESACCARSAILHDHWQGREYLCTTITRDWCPGVVPQALVRSSNWLLVVVVVVVEVGGSKCSTRKEAQRIEQHGSQ